MYPAVGLIKLLLLKALFSQDICASIYRLHRKMFWSVLRDETQSLLLLSQFNFEDGVMCDHECSFALCFGFFVFMCDRLDPQVYIYPGAPYGWKAGTFLRARD